MKNTQQLVNEIYELVGENFPIRFRTEFFKVIEITYDKEWKVGGTVLKDSGEVDDDGNAIMKYVGEYEDKKLTDEQVAIVDNWVKQNIEA